MLCTAWTKTAPRRHLVVASSSDQQSLALFLGCKTNTNTPWYNDRAYQNSSILLSVSHLKILFTAWTIQKFTQLIIFSIFSVSSFSAVEYGPLQIRIHRDIMRIVPKLLDSLGAVHFSSKNFNHGLNDSKTEQKRIKSRPRYLKKMPLRNWRD